MEVFVVMGNDYPDRVFAREEDANAYCARKMQEQKDKAPRMVPRIYYQPYLFEVCNSAD